MIVKNAFELIGVITAIVVSLLIVSSLFGFIVSKIEYRIMKSDNYRKDKRKKDILNQISIILDKDIRYYDFDNITYCFKCNSKNSWIDEVEFKGKSKLNE